MGCSLDVRGIFAGWPLKVRWTIVRLSLDARWNCVGCSLYVRCEFLLCVMWMVFRQVARKKTQSEKDKVQGTNILKMNLLLEPVKTLMD